MKISRRPVLLALSLLVVSLSNPSTCFAADPAFDQWADTFAADWVRTNPTLSTIQQYFPAAEQDGLDRERTPITKEYRAGRVAAARAGLAALGAKFSIKEFHNLGLQTGNVPLAGLEQMVDDWIMSKR